MKKRPVITAEDFIRVFLKAANQNINLNNDSDEQSSSGSSSGGAKYHDPGMSQSILAPDAFSYS